MKLVRDLRLEADRLDLGRALSPIITTFENGDAGAPVGHTWDALCEVLEDMERKAIAGLGQSAQQSLMSKLMARLFGVEARLSPSAEAFARLEGQLEALRAVRESVRGYVWRAAQEKQRPEAGAAGQAPRSGTYAGRSPM